MDASVISALTALFTAIDGFQAITIFAIFLVIPPLFALWAFIKIAAAVSALSKTLVALQEELQEQQTASEKHYLAFERKYDNNIILVQNYEKLAGDLSTIIHLNTQAITRLVDRIDFSQIQASVKGKGQA